MRKYNKHEPLNTCINFYTHFQIYFKLDWNINEIFKLFLYIKRTTRAEKFFRDGCWSIINFYVY